MEELRNKHHIDISDGTDTAGIDYEDMASAGAETAAMPDPRDVEYQALKAAGLLDAEDTPQETSRHSSVQEEPVTRRRQNTAQEEHAARRQQTVEHLRDRLQETVVPDDEQYADDGEIYVDDDEVQSWDNEERERQLDARERELNRREQQLRRQERAARQERAQQAAAPRRAPQRQQETAYQEQPRKEKPVKEKARKEQPVKEKPRKKRHPIRNFLLIILLLILAVLGYFLYRVNSMIEGGLSVSDLESMISDQVRSSTESGAMAGYTNIALFGVDSTEGDLSAGNNRSDIMIIASINKSSGDIKLVSVYRDTYLDIGDGNYQKANAAYAYGGPEQAVAMLNKNLDLNISDYVVTGFEGIASVIDAVGGIEIDVQENEISHLNNYQTTMSQETGLEYNEVTQAGPQTLTGLQATAYCRIRYTDGGDFKRTERQKEVLTKTFDKLKSSGPLTMISVANTVMDKVRTSLSMTEIAALALKATTYHIADTNGFPNESLRTVGYIGDQSCVIPIHLSDNVVWLHQYLFNDEGYAVSDTVQEISSTISARSGY